jgi:hypothetical protein
MHVTSLDKISVSEPTTRNPEPETQEASLKKTQCTGVDAGPVASGYDWRSLGGEGKITWTVIANKSGVEKQNKFCAEQ